MSEDVGREAEQLYSDHKDIQKPIDAAIKQQKRERFMIDSEDADEAAMDRVGEARVDAKAKFAEHQATAAEFARKNIEALQSQAADDMKTERNGEGPNLRPKLEAVPDEDDQHAA